MTTQTPEIDRGLLGRQGEAIPLLGCRLSGRLQGRVGEWALTQRFRNVEKKPIEALYVFPLPEDAAVTGFSVRQGDRVLEGQVEEREKAFDGYDAAMAEGDGAFLLDQERPNVFQLSVGNLLPGQEVQVEIRYVLLAAAEERGVRVMIPTTISPRYSPGHLTTEQRVEIERITPPYADAVPYGLTLELEAVMGSTIRVIDSPSHPLRTELDGRAARISFSQQAVALDRDLVFTIETVEPHGLGVLAVERQGRDHLLLECAPAEGAVDSSGPKTVVFVVDCSGSMDGESIAQARMALELCVRALQPGDRFSVVRFGSQFEPMWPRPQMLDQPVLDEAVSRIHDIRADLGGTEILGALQECERLVPEGRFDLLILTDGQVGNEAEVLAWAGRVRERCRVFSFGIGAGPSEHLIRGLARQGGGAAEFIFPGERLEPKVLRQFSRLGQPLVTDLSFDWGVAGAETAPRQTLPVFAGESLLVAARLPEGKKLPFGHRVTVRGRAGGREITWTAETYRVAEGGGEAAALWWARQALRDLEDNPAEPRKGSNQQRGVPAWQKQAIALSIEYGMLCGNTSFLAIEKRAADAKATEGAELRRVPVQITTGWHGRGQRGVGAGVGQAFAVSSLLGCICPSPQVPAPGPAQKSKGLLSRLSECADAAFSAPKKLLKRPVGKSDALSRLGQFELAEPPAGSSGGEPPLAITLLTLQQVDGWFKLDEVLARQAGRSLDELQTWATELTAASGIDPRRVLATWLVIHLLRTNASVDEDLWRAGVRKAEKWLAGAACQVPGGGDPFAWLVARLSS